MATLYVVTGDQYRTIDRRMRDIKRQLDQRDGSPRDPGLVASALQQIDEGKFDGFALTGFGLFISLAKQLALVRQRNTERNWGFTEEHFAALGEPPAWPEGELCAVVLDVGLDTVQQTFEEAWACIVESQQDNNGCHWRWNGVKSDKDHLRLHGSRSHERGLRWRVIDFAAHWDKKDGVCPLDVRTANSPDSACLWAASYFPRYVRAMDGENVPYMWIPGYELNVDRDAPWTCVPGLSWTCIYHSRVKLIAYLSACRLRNWAFPSLRECSR